MGTAGHSMLPGGAEACGLGVTRGLLVAGSQPVSRRLHTCRGWGAPVCSQHVPEQGHVAALDTGGPGLPENQYDDPISKQGN
jgi:hypothetical protein